MAQFKPKPSRYTGFQRFGFLVVRLGLDQARASLIGLSLVNP